MLKRKLSYENGELDKENLPHLLDLTMTKKIKTSPLNECQNEVKRNCLILNPGSTGLFLAS